MRNRLWQTLIFFAAVFALNQQQASAEIVGKAGRFAGMTVRYKVILPEGYDPAQAYPAILTFSGGRQNLDGVTNLLERTWQAEAEKRGYIVVSPAAPTNQFFFDHGGDRIFPDFLDQILKDYKIEGGKLHIAGPSNGGLSAFHIASLFPQYFRSVTGFPGYLQAESNASMESLKNLCIYMHVGELDPDWIAPMQRQYESLHQKGYRAHFSIEPGEGHGIQSLSGDGAKRLFDQIEEATRGCK